MYQPSPGPQWQPPYGPPPQSPPYQQPQWQQSPQGYPQPSIQPPPKKKKRRIGLWLTLGVIAFVVLSCVSLASKGTQSTTNPTASSTPTVATTHAAAQVPTHIPTITTTTPATKHPTATTVANGGSAVLGGTLDAFIAKLGQPNDHSDTLSKHFERCGNSNVDQIILFQGASSSNRVESVSVQACASWTMSQAIAACAPFFPADAVYKHSVSIPNTQSTFPALDKIYYSASLAHEFAPGDFTDANSNMVQPGLFDVQYLYDNGADTSRVVVCDVQVGTQQTK